MYGCNAGSLLIHIKDFCLERFVENVRQWLVIRAALCPALFYVLYPGNLSKTVYICGSRSNFTSPHFAEGYPMGVVGEVRAS